MALSSIGSNRTQASLFEARGDDGLRQSTRLDVVEKVSGFAPHCREADNDASAQRSHESAPCPLKMDIEGEESRLPYRTVPDPRQENDTRPLSDNEYVGPEVDLTKCILGSLVHDFNNSLQAIVSVLNLLQSRIDQNKPKDFDRLMDVALTSVDKARFQVRRLVDAANPLLYEAKPIEVNSMIESKEVLLASIVGGSIQMGLELGAGEFQVHCNPQQLEDLLLNLVVNSREAMPNGGKLLIETISAVASYKTSECRPEEYVCIRVSDTGIGMSPSTLARAFDPFYTTKRRTNGSGLGLWSVKEFVVRSGGRVTIQSILGKGTSIQVLLPCYFQEPSPPM
jgi:nitrogen-specific signal transduction histidine kinase